MNIGLIILFLAASFLPSSEENSSTEEEKEKRRELERLLIKMGYEDVVNECRGDAINDNLI